MGAVLAKFRKPKTSYEILENLETNIKDIEEYTINTQARQKRYVGNFLVISIGLYITGFLIFYFAFFPPTWVERITYSVPLLIFPLLIFLIKRLVAWYFQRKLNKNTRKLNKLRGEKKKIIEQVMENETYKNAIEILNRFGDKNNGFKSVGVVTPRSKTTNSTTNTPVPVLALTTPLQQQMSRIQSSSPSSSPTVSRYLPLNQQQSTPQRVGDIAPVPYEALGIGGGGRGAGTVAVRNTTNLQMTQIQKKKTPFPIINQKEQGALEKIVDYLIGDGPQNRFAMICKECYGHNGMALQEEFEYTAFRCAFCNTLNPSRKSRPFAPKLPSVTVTIPTPPPSTASSIASKSKKHISDERKDSTSTTSVSSERESDLDLDDFEFTEKIPDTDDAVATAGNVDEDDDTKKDENKSVGDDGDGGEEKRDDFTTKIINSVDDTQTTITTEETDIIDNLKADDEEKSSVEKKND